RAGVAPGTTLYSTGNGQVVPLPISPGMRGNLVSRIRMPTREPYSPLPPWAVREGSNSVISAPDQRAKRHAGSLVELRAIRTLSRTAGEGEPSAKRLLGEGLS